MQNNDKTIEAKTGNAPILQNGENKSEPPLVSNQTNETQETADVHSQDDDSVFNYNNHCRFLNDSIRDVHGGRQYDEYAKAFRIPNPPEPIYSTLSEFRQPFLIIKPPEPPEHKQNTWLRYPFSKNEVVRHRTCLDFYNDIYKLLSLREYEDTHTLNPKIRGFRCTNQNCSFECNWRILTTAPEQWTLEQECKSTLQHAPECQPLFKYSCPSKHPSGVKIDVWKQNVDRKSVV